jgi:hypothetical protein
MSNRIVDYSRCAFANEFTRKGYIALGAIVGLETTFAVLNNSGYDIDRTFIGFVMETAMAMVSAGFLLGSGFGLGTYLSFRESRERIEGKDYVPLDQVMPYQYMVYCPKKGLELAAKDAKLEIPKDITPSLVSRLLAKDPDSFELLGFRNKERVIGLFVKPQYGEAPKVEFDFSQLFE